MVFGPSLSWTELKASPELLNEVALWHQRAWPHNSLSERLSRLRLHLNDQPIPTTFVAFIDNQAVGSVSLVAYQQMGGIKPSHWVANVFVLESLRRQGIGARLLQKIADYGRQLQLQRLQLYATDHLQFYTQLGWKVESRRDYRQQAAYIMGLQL